VALYGNCGKEGQLPPECLEPFKPRMLVRYAQEPTPKLKTELVRLVYTDTNNSESCGTVTLVENASAERIFNVRHVPTVYVQSKVYDIEVPNLVKEEVIGKPHRRIQKRDKMLEVLATTRSKKGTESDIPRKEKKSKKRSKEKNEKKEGKEEQEMESEEETSDGAYDRYDPKYYLPNISSEVKQYLQ
jgi:hypothetical protein